MRLVFLATFFSCLFFTFSCHKKESPQPASLSCTTKITSDNTGSDSTVYFYSNGKLMYVQTYGIDGSKKDSLTYTYSANRVITRFYDSFGFLHITLDAILDNNGLATTEYIYENYSTFELFDTVSYLYNSEGYLIEQINRQTSNFYNPISTTYINRDQKFVITNGNVTSDTTWFNGVKTVNTNSYYLDKLNKSQLSTHAYSFGGLPFYGKQSVNLIKSSIMSNNTSTQFTYDFDNSGYVTRSSILEYTGSSSVNRVFSYYYGCE